MEFPNLDYENLLNNKYKYIAGLDEAGRGALAGPVVAVAVIIGSTKIDDLGINDSKKISETKREIIFDELINRKINYGIGIINNAIIDEINILNATYKAFHLAIENLRIKPDFLLIDGNRFKENGIEYQCIVKGDSKSLSIATASILAKVIRDRIMRNFNDSNLINYGFSSHKGYGTRKHFEAIEKFGISYIHRKSFLNKLNHKQIELFT